MKLLDLIINAGPYILLSLAISYVSIGGVVNYLKLRQFRGPPLAGFSRIWMFWQTVNARLATAQFEALEKYGPICRIGPNVLTTSDARITRHINAPRSRWRRSTWYESMKFDPRLDTVFSTRDEQIHTDLKAKEAGAYSGRNIDTLESDIDVRTTEFMDLIKHTHVGKCVDLANLTRYYTLDVLSTVAFGKPFGFMTAKGDLWNYNKTMDGFLFIVELAGSHKFFRRIFSSSIVQSLTSPKVTDETGIGPAIGFAREAVAERFRSDPKLVKNDMLGHFISKGLSQQQCESEAFLQIIAGSDSTTALLRYTIYNLAGIPASYKKLQAELDTAATAGQMSSPVITYAEAQKLPFLQACIWETMRMCPPLLGLKSKVAPPGGDTINGVYFPEGTEVLDCNDAVNRSESIFGLDADVYRPERWLDADTETRLRYERTVETIFGTGRYLCLGKHIGLMELYKSVAELMRHFDWSIVNPTRGIRSKEYVVRVQWDMNVIARSRD